jgi:predicted nucleotidyltransferase/DNA-binding transcriptional regulator YiaG
MLMPTHDSSSINSLVDERSPVGEVQVPQSLKASNQNGFEASNQNGFEALDAAVLITHARKVSGLTQHQLAARAGTSQSAIARYENGVASPSTDTLARVLKANGLKLEVQLVPATLSNLASPRAKLLREKRGEILKLARKYEARNVRVFGSVARGEDDEESDIDLLVEMDLQHGVGKLIHLKAELKELLEAKVDVAPIGLLKKAVLNNALMDAVPL